MLLTDPETLGIGSTSAVNNTNAQNSSSGHTLGWANEPFSWVEDNYSVSYQDLDGFSLGYSNGPQVLAVNGYADASFNVGLQGIAPCNSASVQISLGDILNLNAWANAGATGTVAASAATQGTLTITDTILNGTLFASLSIDASGYIAADQASVQLHITDVFQMGLSGTGYSGVTLQTTSQSGGTVVATAPSGAGASPGCYGDFDLARFAASVLGTGQSNITFIASEPGETLQGVGTSVMTVVATAEIPGAVPESLTYCDVDRSGLSFADGSTYGGSGPYGFQGCGSPPINLYHSG
jgi:hypothetical protein